MIPHGKEMKPRAASSGKYKPQEENVTLGNVVNRLNLTREKMVERNAKKAAIWETLHRASRTHNVVSSGEAKDPHEVVFEMKSMRKSLQSQLKNGGRKTPGSDGNIQFPSRKKVGVERGHSAGMSSDVSSYSGVSAKRNGNEKKYYRKESRETPSTAKQQTTLNRPHEYPRSVYSRHMTTSTPRITLDSDSNDHSEMAFRKNSQSKAYVLGNETSRRQSDSDSRLDLEFSNCHHDVFLSASDSENGGIVERKTLPVEISYNEKEVLNQFTDPQLKESLQNIIKRRRSSVRFVKSESGYEMVNLEKTIGEMLEEETSGHELQQVAESESVVEIGDKSETRSVKSATSRRVSANHERLTSAATTTSGIDSCHGAVSSRQTRTRSRKIGRQEQGIPSMRRISSARSCMSSASNLTQRTLSSPILRRRKPELQTEETRVIRPATAKGYVPNLTSRKILRKVSAVSCPEISQNRDQARTLAQVNMIREFLLMYTKVAAKNEDGLTGCKPVRMMSQTPELVIKSAIGQFLTRAFPSGEREEWTGLSAKSKKERYEEQQRSKLLRIKICMKHLASVA